MLMLMLILIYIHIRTSTVALGAQAFFASAVAVDTVLALAWFVTVLASSKAALIHFFHCATCTSVGCNRLTTCQISVVVQGVSNAHRLAQARLKLECNLQIIVARVITAICAHAVA